MPWRAASSVNSIAAAEPTTRSIGSCSGSMTVTGRPRDRADDATSAPMNPLPTMATGPPAAKQSRIASASWSVRSTCTPGRSCQGDGRADAPVAITQAP